MSRLRRVLAGVLLLFVLSTILPVYGAIGEKITDTSINGWTFIINNVDGGAYIDTTKGLAKGKASLKIVNKTPNTMPGKQGAYGATNVPVKMGETYCLEFDAMAENAVNAWYQINTMEYRYTLTPFSKSYDWVSYKRKYTAKADGNISLMFGADDATDAIWIDNIRFYNINDEKNLVTNGDFENCTGPSEPDWDALGEVMEIAEQNSPVYSILPRKITVDGKLDDWSDMEFHPIDKLFEIETPVGNVIEGRIGYAYDEENFYFAIDVNDPTHYASRDIQYWNCDGVQFGISGISSSGFTECGIVYYDDKGEIYKENGSYFDTATTQSEGGIVYETVIPWKNFFKQEVPDSFVFNAIVNNNDGNGRKSCIELAPGISASKNVGTFCVMNVLKPVEDTYMSVYIPDKVVSGKAANALVTLFNTSEKNANIEITSEKINFSKKVSVASKQKVTVEIPIIADKFETGNLVVNVVLENQTLNFNNDIEVIKIYDQNSYVQLREKLESYATQLKELILKGEKRGFPLDYEIAEYTILSRFIMLLDTEAKNNDYTRMYEYEKQLTKIYENAKSNLEAYLNGTKQPLRVPKYVTSEIKTDGISVVANTFDGEKYEERPVFFVGYGNWEASAEDMPFLSGIGGNMVQLVLPMSDVLLPYETAGWLEGVSGTPKVEMKRSNKDKSTDKYSMHISRPANVGGSGYRIIYQPLANVKPNTTYEWGLKSKGSGIASDAAHLCLKGLEMKTRTPIKDSNVWTEHNYTYTTGENETSLNFTLLFQGNIGELYIDDCYVREAGTDENLLANGGFEGLIPEDKMTPLEREAAELGLTFDYDGIGNYSREGLKWARNVCEWAENHNIMVDFAVGGDQFPAFILDAENENMRVSKGYIPFDLNNETARKVMSLYARLVADIASEYDSVASICLTNEPTLKSANYIQYKDDWLNYLKEKYGTIENLNKEYKSEYKVFEDVVVDEKKVQGILLVDYKEFNDSQLANFHKWLYNEVKTAYPELKIHTKTMGQLDVAGVTLANASQFQVRGDDYELIADTMDLNGCDSACWNGVGWQMAWYDMMTSMSEKPVWDTESHITKDFSDPGEEIVDYNDIDPVTTDLHVWNGGVHGLGGEVLWLWDLRGYSMPWTGNPLYCNANFVHRPNSVHSMSKATLDLNRLSKEVYAIQKAKRKVGVLHSRISMSYSNTDTYEAYYNTVCNGQKVMFVYDTLPENMHECELLIVPTGLTHVKKDMLKNIKNFIDNGGKVLLLAEDLLKYDETNKPHDEEILSYIYSKADTNSSVSEKIHEMNMSEIVLIDAKTGDVVEDVEWTYAKHNGKYVVNIANYDMDNSKTIKVKRNNSVIGGFKELRTNEYISDCITLSPYQAVLIQFGL